MRERFVPFRYRTTSHTEIYRSKRHDVLKRNFEVFPVQDGIAAVTAHIPNQCEHLVRYYGWYSNVNRGKRKKAEEPAHQGSPAGTVEISPRRAHRSPSTALGRVDQEGVCGRSAVVLAEGGRDAHHCLHCPTRRH